VNFEIKIKMKQFESLGKEDDHLMDTEVLSVKTKKIRLKEIIDKYPF
jgi:hypothetical protein